MKNIINPPAYVILSFFSLIFLLQCCTFASAQNKIKLPVYVITRDELKSLFAKGKHSKIVTSLKIEDAGLNITSQSSLDFFSYSKKDLYRQNTAKLFSEVFDTSFVPFLITNTEILISELEPALPNYKDMAGEYFYLVPSIVKTSYKDKSFYSLVFTIKYLDKKYENLLTAVSENKKINLGGEGEHAGLILSSLTTVKTLNPCPPARSA